jgi:hypothetical protein
MSENIHVATGVFTVVSNGAAVINIDCGFVPTTVELTNETVWATKLYTVDATTDVIARNASVAGAAVNYDSNNSGSEGGTVATLHGAGFTIKAALATLNDTTNEVLRWVARR